MRFMRPLRMPAIVVPVREPVGDLLEGGISELEEKTKEKRKIFSRFPGGTKATRVTEETDYNLLYMTRVNTDIF